jgi:hypothetical protein
MTPSPTSVARVASRYLQAGRPDGDWSDYDTSAPNTIWGKAQTMYEIQRGVRWFSTAGHGGLAIADGVARKTLTPAAYKMGAKSWGYLWYEEDVAYAIPFYEHPEWGVILSHKAGGSAGSKEQFESTIKHYFPQYFTLLEEGGTHPAKPTVGAKVVFKRDVRFGGGTTIPEGTEAVIRKATPSTLTLETGWFTPVGSERPIMGFLCRVGVRDLGGAVELV